MDTMADSKPGRKPDITDDELVAAIRGLLAQTGEPVVTPIEIVEVVPLKRRGLLRRLQSLVEDGRLRTKKVGARARVYWLDDDDPSGNGTG